MFVKVCGVTSVDDARAAVDAGADAIGVIVAESPRRVSLSRASDIARALPRGVRCIGVFRDAPADDVVAAVRAAGLHGAQLHGSEDPEVVARIRSAVPFVIRAFAAGSGDVASAERWRADAVLVDASTPGSGSTWDWRVFDRPRGTVRIVLAGGLGPGNVAAGIRELRPWGVDASSALELEPGRKDHDAVRRFVAAARAAGDTLTAC